MNVAMVRILIVAGITLGLSCNYANEIDQIKHQYLVKAESISKAQFADTLKFPNRYTAIVKYRHTKQLWMVSGFVDSSMYGHSFSFDATEELSEYKFMTDDVHYNYGVIFNNESNKYDEIGKPKVGYWRTPVRLDGKKDIVVLFARFPRRNLNAQYSEDGKNFKELKLEESITMPYLFEAKVNLQEECGKIYLKMYAEKLYWPLDGLKDQVSFTDSIIIN